MAIYTTNGPFVFELGIPGIDRRPREVRNQVDVLSDEPIYIGGIDWAEGYHRSAQVTPNTMPRDQGNRHTRRRAAALARHQTITTRSY